MRIIAGRYRGRKLETMAGTQLRPTSDRLRETLFNVLAPVIEESVFLDCYAGSGAVGLEAFSRGAGEVIWIESNEPAARLIEANAGFLEPEDRRLLVRKPVRSGLRQLEQRVELRGVRVDICFLDPPYEETTDAVRALLWLAGSNLMQPTGLLILEHSKRFQTPERLETNKTITSVGTSDDASDGDDAGWARSRLLVQGDSALSFYRRQ